MNMAEFSNDRAALYHVAQGCGLNLNPRKEPVRHNPRRIVLGAIKAPGTTTSFFKREEPHGYPYRGYRS